MGPFPKAPLRQASEPKLSKNCPLLRALGIGKVAAQNWHGSSTSAALPHRANTFGARRRRFAPAILSIHDGPTAGLRLRATPEPPGGPASRCPNAHKTRPSTPGLLTGATQQHASVKPLLWATSPAAQRTHPVTPLASPSAASSRCSSIAHSSSSSAMRVHVLHKQNQTVTVAVSPCQRCSWRARVQARA